MLGNNIYQGVSSVPTKTAQKCYDLCKRVKGCVGIAWSNKNHPSNPLGCRLKSTLAAVVANQNTMAIDMDGETVQHGWDYPGHDIGSPFIPRHGEARECADICNSVATCQATVLRPASVAGNGSPICLLKAAAAGNTVSVANVISVDMSTCKCDQTSIVG